MTNFSRNSIEMCRNRLKREYGITPVSNEEEDFLQVLCDHLSTQGIAEGNLFDEIKHQIEVLPIFQYQDASPTFRGFRTKAKTQAEIDQEAASQSTNIEFFQFEDLANLNLHDVVMIGPVIAEIVDFRNIREPTMHQEEEDLGEVEEGSIQEEIMQMEEETGGKVSVKRRSPNNRMLMLLLTNGLILESEDGMNDEESGEDEEDEETKNCLSFQAMEYNFIPNFEGKVKEKVVFRNVIIKRGMLMMTPRNTKNLTPAED